MKKSVTLFAVLLLIAALYHPVRAQSNLSPVVAPQKILDSIMGLLIYKRDYLRFAEEFTAYDSNAKLITKEQFLKSLGTGAYVPVALSSGSEKKSYQLQKLPEGIDRDFRTIIRQWGETYYNQYSREGQGLPSMDFVDLNGKRYTFENTRGKILVIKCWFINCLPCVQEMPRLNQVVEHFRKRKDILFVSLAIDPQDKLKDFLKKTKFSYAVVPDKENYMQKELKIGSYPTHLIVNKQGKIFKMVSRAEELVVALNEVAKK
ncbi:MAG TPA: TlpA disulfide reductase family protein [Sphingobacteriaceae bacterium]